ncbi:glycosyl hydrolase [Microbacterium marinilacus]|uniref:Glycoside hydrolase n=1 Tax=Microbacterium marinilacus TaxID=415209 RepID=A0ABP7BE56_9MICO|nr:glycosyl hydrolase [Microbacterium marinilacus]MBY0689407.1 hypothetical protein [Microbacterium marinilacus]
MTSTALDVVRAVREGGPHGRPLMRWWWFSSHLSAEAIDADLDAMAAAGIGGVEACFVYPVAEHGTGFLSPAFLELVSHAARGAAARGLRFDLTLGAGWPFGGPHVDEDLAARRLHWERIEVAPGIEGVGYRAPLDGDRVIAAYAGAGSLQEPPREWQRVELSAREAAHEGAGSRIEVPLLGRGPRVVLVAVSRLTGQNVKRAPHGAEGLVLDHYSAAAASAHLDRVAAPLVGAAGAERVHAGFCDSFEVFDADWTPSLPDEFRVRRGYELLPELWMLHAQAPGSERLRADVLATLTELFEEAFLATFRRWAAAHDILFRAQCYGEPPMLMSSFRHVDLFEGEGWGWRRWTKNGWAVSAAGAYGRTLVSSETWTWVRSPSFRAGPFDLLGEAYEHLLGGVNLLVGHGWPLGAALGDGQPVFYASGALDARNPWWPVAPELFTGLGRMCAALQLGTRVAQVAIYHPVAELRARPDGERPLDLWRQTRRFVDDDFLSAVRTEGLDADVLDDDMLRAGGAERFDVVLVPAGCTPTPVAEEVLRRSGRRVVRLSAAEGEARTAEIRGALAGLVPPLSTSRPTTVGVTTRRLDDAWLSLVVNTAETDSTVTLSAADRDRVLTVWDAVTGEARTVAEGGVATIRLGSYEGVLVAQAGRALDTAPEAAPSGAAISPTGWALASPDGTREVSLPHVWEDDPLVPQGTERLAYEAELHLPEGGAAVLDFGDPLPPPPALAGAGGLRGNSFAAPATPPIGAAARVLVDGTPAGGVWRTPSTVSLGTLAAGVHRLRVEVTGLGVGPTAAGAADGAAAEVRAATGARFRVQDAASRADGVRSGILRAPVVRITR